MNVKMTSISEKFEAKSLGELNKPVFIVGQCPGKQRKDEQTRVVWSGNRSGKFISEILQGKTNIYLTNILNYHVDGAISDELVVKGISELQHDIEKLNPRKIICLGNFAGDTIKNKLPLKIYIPIVILNHPSYILRFNKDKNAYTRKLLNNLR